MNLTASDIRIGNYISDILVPKDFFKSQKYEKQQYAMAMTLKLGMRICAPSP